MPITWSSCERLCFNKRRLKKFLTNPVYAYYKWSQRSVQQLQDEAGRTPLGRPRSPHLLPPCAPPGRQPRAPRAAGRHRQRLGQRWVPNSAARHGTPLVTDSSDCQSALQHGKVAPPTPIDGRPVQSLCGTDTQPRPPSCRRSSSANHKEGARQSLASFPSLPPRFPPSPTVPAAS